MVSQLKETPTSSASIGFQAFVFDINDNTWEDGSLMMPEHNNIDERNFDVEYDPVNNVFVVAIFENGEGNAHVYTYDIYSQIWNDISLCQLGVGSNNGIKLNYNPNDRMSYITIQHSNTLRQSKIDVASETCIESVIHAVSSDYNDADAIVFDSKRNRFLYLKSDFNPNDHGNELTIMEFNDDTDPEDGDLSEYTINYRDFSGYHFSSEPKMQAIYLPNTDKVLEISYA